MWGKKYKRTLADLILDIKSVSTEVASGEKGCGLIRINDKRKEPPGANLQNNH